MKKILFFLLVLASFTLSAQNEQMREMMRTMQPSRNVTDVPAANIQFWVGSGSNEVVAAFFFCANPAVGIAYGYRFDGTATILDMLNAINAADPNFHFVFTSWIEEIGYNNGTLNCLIESGMLMYNLNGSWPSGSQNTPLSNGDYFELCEYGDCSLPTTNIYYPVDPTAPTAVDATIDPDDILYWVGEGDNDVVFVVNWCDTAIAMAWGVHFNGNNITVADILDTIWEYDDRFDYDASSGFVNDITYWDGIYDLSLQGDYFMYNVNGGSAMGIESQYVYDGDYIKFGDEMCGIHDDFWNFIWTTPVVPVSDPNGEEHPEDATIDAADILYWVGTGSNEIIMAINWADPDTCLAWGVRFDGAYITNAQALDSMAVADPRFSYSGASMLDELFFVTDNNDTLRLTANSYWSNNVNGNQSAGINAQLHDGDFSKWGDIAVGIGYDFMDWGGVLYPMSMAWVTPVVPVPAPQDPDPEDATIAPEDILYWVGTGSNEIIMAINWADPDTCLAWGVRFDGAYITNAQALDSMAVADPRFSYSGASMLDELFFVTDNNDTLRLTANSYWSNNVNGNQSAGINAQLHDGDFSKWGDIAVGIGYDFMDWGGVLYPMSMAWVTPVTPVPAPQDPDPEDATIAPEDILYWVGTGNNEIIMAINWAEPDTCLAWGVRFDGDHITNAQALDSMAVADPRFSFSGASMLDELFFVTDNNDTLRLTANSYWSNNVNGNQSAGINAQLHDGDFSKWGDIAVGIGYDFMDWGGVLYPMSMAWVTPVTPVPAPQGDELVDATISSDNIIYWVGNGDNEVVVAVNWCNPSQAMAWGVRFTGTNAVVADIIHTIELYDSRVNFDGEENGYISNITFADGTHDNYTSTGYWMYNVNGVGAMLGVNQQTAQNGDVIKFGDSGCADAVDANWTYTWTTPIQPVDLPTLSTEHFDGIAESTGCQAIKFDNPSILGWATSCVITRGYQCIDSATTYASYGTDNDGVGPSSNSTGEGVVSLGDAGYAVLTFGMPITNGEGYDFAVFENALNHTFLELAFVEVSSDGEHYYRFPSVSNTQTTQQIGNGGALDATNLHNLAGKYKVGWGTPFDLEELAGYSNLDINNVTHVRVVDVVGSINPMVGTTDKNGHIINDPYPTAFHTSGFDLSGVAVMNGWTPTPSAVNEYQQEISFMAYPNPCQNVLNISTVTINEPISLFNATGQQIWSGMTQDTYFQLDMQSYPAGMYMLQIGSQMTKIVKK